MSSLNSISSEKLWRLIGVPHGPALIDVRAKEDFAADPRFIPGPRGNTRQYRAGAESLALAPPQKSQKVKRGLAALFPPGALRPRFFLPPPPSRSPLPNTSLPALSTGAPRVCTREKNISHPLSPCLLPLFLSSNLFLFSSPQQMYLSRGAPTAPPISQALFCPPGAPHLTQSEIGASAHPRGPQGPAPPLSPPGGRGPPPPLPFPSPLPLGSRRERGNPQLADEQAREIDVNENLETTPTSHQR